MSNILTNNINPRSGNLITIGGVNDRVSIAGTLTYEDVSSVDSVGIITARGGLNVGPLAGIACTISAAGAIRATSIIKTESDSGFNAKAIAAGQQFAFRATDNGNNNNAVIYSDGSGYLLGNTGIGTDNPTGRLEISSTDGTTILTGTRGSGHSYKFETTGLDAEGFNVIDATNSQRIWLYYAGTTPSTDSYQTFHTNAIERMRLDSSGRLLLGTATAVLDTSNALLQIGAAAGANMVLYRDDSSVVADDSLGLIRFYSNAGGSKIEHARISGIADGTAGGVNGAPGRLVFYTEDVGSDSDPVERMRIGSDGNATFKYKVIVGDSVTGGEILSLGKSSGTSYMSFNNGGTSLGFMGYADQLVSGGGSDDLAIRSQDDFIIATGGNTQRLLISSTGETTLRPDSSGIGVRSIAGASSVTTGLFVAHSSGSMTTGTISCEIYTNGDIKNTNNSYGSLSDERLKENIVEASSQWEDIKALRIRNFNFSENTGHQTHRQIGLIAQEVEIVCPGLVQENPVKEGDLVFDKLGNKLESTKSVTSSILHMKSVKALQEAMERIETLEQRLTDAGL